MAEKTPKSLKILLEDQRITLQVDGQPPVSSGSAPLLLDREATLNQLSGLYQQTNPEKYGITLLKSIFDDALYAEFRRSVEKEQVSGIEIDLQVTDPVLEDLWWEALREANSTLGRSKAVSFFRNPTEGPPREEREKQTAEKIRALVVIVQQKEAGSQADRPGAAPDIRPFFEELRKKFKGELELELLDEAPTFYHIVKRLESEQAYNMLFLLSPVGFDKGEPGLWLEKSSGGPFFCNQYKLSELITKFPALKMLVLFNTGSIAMDGICPCLPLARKVYAEGIPAVLAVRETMPPVMTEAFFEKLAKTMAEALLGSSETSVGQMINSVRDHLHFISEDPGWDWAKPVLFYNRRLQFFRPQTSAGRRTGSAREAGSPGALPVQPFETDLEKIYAYCIYDEEHDAQFFDELEKNLKTYKDILLERFSVGTDRGTDESFEKAKLFLFLISPDFISKEELYRWLPRAKEKGKTKKAKLIGIYIRPTSLDDQEEDLRNLVFIPDKTNPIVKWPNQDSAWVFTVSQLKQWANIVRELEKAQKEGYQKALEDMKKKSRESRTVTMEEPSGDKLLQQLKSGLSTEDLNELCRRMNIDVRTLEGISLEKKKESLLNRCERENRLKELQSRMYEMEKIKA